MKRFVLFCFVLIFGAGLGAGGLYVGLNWKRFNPFKDLEAIELAVADTTAQLRKSCSEGDDLKGAAIHTVRIDEGRLLLRGWVARKEQIALLEAKARTLMSASPALAKECDAGISLDTVKVLPIAEQLPKLQNDFDAGRGFEQDPTYRLLLRRTRIDSAAFDDQARLTVRVVSVGSTEARDTVATKIADALRNRLESPEMTAADLPEIVVKVEGFDNPARPLMKALAADETNRGIHVVGAWYDAKGVLRLDALIAKEEQRKTVENAVDALAKDALTRGIVAKPADKNAKPQVSLRVTLFDPAPRTAALQKLLVQYAIKANKPLLRRAVIQEVTPKTVLKKDSGDTASTGNASHVFQVAARMFATAGERALIEADLAVWLPTVLPSVVDFNLSPMPARLAVTANDPPMAALQARIVERGLDGAFVTDVRFDETGRLELLGRTHAPMPEAKPALDAVVKDVLTDVPTWSIDTLAPHEWKARKEPIPAWSEVVAGAQRQLAETNTEARRVRLDRLYFQFVNRKLVLQADGAFLADGPKESPVLALTSAIDATIVSRDKLAVDAGKVKAFVNPLVELQNRATERSELDGILLTSLGYTAAGELRFDGYLGEPGQKPKLEKLIAERLETMPGAARPSNDRKPNAGWSIAGLSPYPREKTTLAWTDLLRAFQTDFAEAEELTLRRTCVQRSYFRYEGSAERRQLVLRWQGTYLAKRGQKTDPKDLSRTIQNTCKRLLPESALAPVEGEVTVIESPIYELQQTAVANKSDGLLFLEASFDKAGKLVFDGMRGNDEQLKTISTMIDRIVNDKDRKPIAPAGVAGLERLKPTPWLPLLADIRSNFAGDKNALFRQTRIDRVYYTIDEVKMKPIVHVHGICIFSGKTLADDARTTAITEMLRKRLEAHQVEGFEINIAGVDRKKNPSADMQKQANDAGIGGAVFTQIGFDAKGACYIVVPFVPKGQDDVIRKLIDDFAKSHSYLGPIRQVVSVPAAEKK